MDYSALPGDHTDRRAYLRTLFLDRHDAGRRLADRLQAFRGPDVVVLGVPRGGVTVAYEIAARLRLPLDTIVVNKLRVPYRPELAFGAIGEQDTRIIDEVVVRSTFLTHEELTDTESHERGRLSRRSERFRRHGPRAKLGGCTALVVDDGVTTASPPGRPAAPPIVAARRGLSWPSRSRHIALHGRWRTTRIKSCAWKLRRAPVPWTSPICASTGSPTPT
ncbi:phosphoribosyltransferase [Nocardia suismassiliense]|uniref:Phosphoribosyltransferase n=1 Tax=Nocardia suismassiliense TaxID=2077092 RepID=A0ABW6R029_9NOCA